MTVLILGNATEGSVPVCSNGVFCRYRLSLFRRRNRSRMEIKRLLTEQDAIEFVLGLDQPADAESWRWSAVVTRIQRSLSVAGCLGRIARLTATAATDLLG